MAITISAYDNFIEDVLRSRINLVSDVFKAVLVYEYEFDSAHSDITDITGMLSDGNGYSPQTLANLTISFGAGKTKWDADDLLWVADGGTIGPATGLVIYSDTSTTPAADRLVLYVDFGGEQSAIDGKDIIAAFGTLGVMSIGPVA